MGRVWRTALLVRLARSPAVSPRPENCPCCSTVQVKSLMNTDLLSDIVEYRCKTDLDLYDSPDCRTLATQAIAGRHLQLRRSHPPGETAVRVQLCEDDYPAWLSAADREHLEIAPALYRPQFLTRPDIRRQLPKIIQFVRQALEIPNTYLWGGTTGPNYDCSGLVQTAFARHGIWLPRDAYQQEAFVEAIAPVSWELQPGDLIFFGPAEKATHVGLYLGDGRYIHSSGPEHGRDGIGVDRLWQTNNEVSRHYAQQLRGVGRVATGYPFDRFGRFRRLEVEF